MRSTKLSMIWLAALSILLVPAVLSFGTGIASPVSAIQADDKPACPCTPECNCENCTCLEDVAEEEAVEKEPSELHLDTLHVRKLLVTGGFVYQPEGSKYTLSTGKIDDGLGLWLSSSGKPMICIYASERTGAVIGLGGPTYGGGRKANKSGLDVAIHISKDFEPRVQVNDGQTTRSFCLGQVADLLQALGATK